MPGYSEPGTFAHQFAPPSTQKLYGSVQVDEEYAPKKEGLGQQRARVDVLEVLLSIFLPLAIFMLASAVLSFRMRYNLWPLAWIIALCCVLPAVHVRALSKNAFKESEESSQGKWKLFLCTLCFLAWALALMLGVMNYSTNMKPFYDMSALNYYPSVDPSTSGQSHIDAGRILFQPGSHLGTTRAMGVKVGTTYCVAPVVNPSTQKGLRTDEVEYDYWAVGENCCSSVQPQTRWTCGEINNPLAHAGMRLMTDAPQAFYRMAVQEAEATYKIRAKNPIFLHWMQDPAAQMTAWRENGTRIYLQGVVSLFVLLCFSSVVATLYLSSLDMESYPCARTGFVKYARDSPDHSYFAEEEEAGNVKNLTL